MTNGLAIEIFLQVNFSSISGYRRFIDAVCWKYTLFLFTNSLSLSGFGWFNDSIDFFLRWKLHVHPNRSCLQKIELSCFLSSSKVVQMFNARIKITLVFLLGLLRGKFVLRIVLRLGRRISVSSVLFLKSLVTIHNVPSFLTWATKCWILINGRFSRYFFQRDVVD